MASHIRSVGVVTGTTLFLGLLGASHVGCASDMRIGIIDTPDGAAPGPLSPPDAAPDTSVKTLLCATAECPAGTTTCETSSARCDVDVTADRNNCGACGAACPPDQHKNPWDWDTGPNLEVIFTCVDSKCVMACQGGFGDCDGIPDNGCEVDLREPSNCGTCGNACASGVPCVGGKCGCNAPEVACDGFCVDTQSAVSHCGACGSACTDPSPPPPEHNLQMDCVNGQCKRTCRSPFADCNGDPSDGCEKDLSVPDDQNCGECGSACQAGTTCDVYDEVAARMRCSCPAGLQRCSFGGDRYLCVDTLTDPTNCGGCGVICTYDDTEFSRPICRGGLCGVVCKTGRGDCNGFAGDGCEINLDSDPQNCGTCGHACDAEIGQPCVKGQCVEAECRGANR